MKRRLIPALIFLMLAALACEFDQGLTPPTLPAPTARFTVTPTPPPTVTPAPTITPTPPLAASNGPVLLELHMFGDKRGWGVTGDMILSTQDGAVNWAQVPLPGVKVDASTGTFFHSADIAYFVVPVPNAQIGQFFATRNGGQTWQINPVPFSTARLDFIDDNIGFAFQTLSQTQDMMTVAIYQTLDRGATWTQVFIHAANQGDKNLPVIGIKSGMSAIEAGIGFIGLLSQKNKIGLYSSRDSGRTWVNQELTPPVGLGAYISSVWPLCVIQENRLDGFLPVDFVSTETGADLRAFYVTHDAGATWALAGSIPDGDTQYFLDTKTGWAAGEHSLYYTADGAQTWTQLPVAFGRSEHATIIDFIDPNNGWLVTVDTKNNLHMYRTNDGGNTWTIVIF